MIELKYGIAHNPRDPLPYLLQSWEQDPVIFLGIRVWTKKYWLTLSQHKTQEKARDALRYFLEPVVRPTEYFTADGSIFVGEW